MMFTSVTPSDMRRIVLRSFAQHDSRSISNEELQEHARVEDGKIVAYCYEASNLFAMWMVEVGLVQFYDDRGTMLQTLDLKSITTERRQAA